MRLKFVKAGEIVTTHGVRGEIKVLPWTDGPEFLTEFKRVYIDRVEYMVVSCRVQKGCNLLVLSGVNSMEEALAMRGKTVEVSRDDTDPELIFADELIGVAVFAKGQKLGEIVDVLDYPGNKVYVVRGEYEYMIPAVKAFVLSTDIDSSIMEVQLIEGMRSDES